MPNRRTINNGYIKLFRKFFDGELWQEPRVYSKAEAWIDLIEMARWGNKPETLLDKRGSYILEYGDVYISLRYLGERWRWSKNKARHFLEYLERKESIVFKKRDSHRTIINLVNLEVYLGWESGRRDSEGTVKGQSRDSEGTKKKPLKPLEPEEPKDVWNPPEGLNLEAWSDYEKLREGMPKKDRMTDQAKKLAANQLVKVSKEDQQEMVNISIMNNWKGLFELKNKKGFEAPESSFGYDSPRNEIKG